MSDGSNISWCDATWNPTVGCTQIPGAHGGPSGCDFCYAKRLVDTRMTRNPKSAHFGLPFERVLTFPERLSIPLKWRRPRKIFVNSMSDLFHKDVNDEFIDRVFDVMAAASRHTFQVLTKRPDRMRSYMISRYDALPPPRNIWMGTSIENADCAWRADLLRVQPAFVRFLSIEPLLGPIPHGTLNGMLTRMNWVIVGGESGPDARPMHPGWAIDIRDECRKLRIPFFFKQQGEFVPRGPLIDGEPLPCDNARTIILNYAGNTRGRLAGSATNHLEQFSDRSWDEVMERVGTRKAGDLLEGRLYHEFPDSAER